MRSVLSAGSSASLSASLRREEGAAKTRAGGTHKGGGEDFAARKDVGDVAVQGSVGVGRRGGKLGEGERRKARLENSWRQK
eukprot:2974896-Pleurochrysis_carterae.AAC.1